MAIAPPRSSITQHEKFEGASSIVHLSSRGGVEQRATGFYALSEYGCMALLRKLIK